MVKLLAGGFSSQLSRYIDEPIDGHPLWTARFLYTAKDKCLRVHRDFVKAGADIIYAATYQATIGGFKQHMGLTEEESIALIKEAVALAKRAVDLESDDSADKKDVLVCGSVGPYGAHLHDGSEYTGSYADRITKQELMDWHRPKIRALIEGGADLLALETIPCSLEAFALVELLKEFPNAKAWLSFSIKDTNSISNGENFSEVASKCWTMSTGQLVAVGANCYSPSWVSPLVKNLRARQPSIPFVAYPNSTEVFNKAEGRWMNENLNKTIADYIEEWLDLGVSYIGGCCRITDNEIKQMRQEINKYFSKKNTNNG